MRMRYFMAVAVLVIAGLVFWQRSDHPAGGRPAHPARPGRAAPSPARHTAPKAILVGFGTVTPPVATGVVEAAAALPKGAPMAVALGTIAGEHVFHFYNAADRAEFVRLARSLGLEILGEMAHGNGVRVRVGDEDTLRRLLTEGPKPTAHGPNYYIRPPDNSMLERQAQTQPYKAFGDQLLNWLGMEGRSDNAGRGVTIAVLDTAVGVHPSLNEKQVLRMNPFGVDPTGPNAAHGTAVASLIIGNGAGVSGVAPGARIISIPVMNGNGVGDTFTLAQAIEEAIALNVDIINLSLGTAGDSKALRDAIAHAAANNIATVVAAGNDAVNAVAYPARYDMALAVGGVDDNDAHLHFSNTGSELDLVAPGYGVEAAWGGENHALMSGTSVSAPIVSGGMAVLLSANPSLKPIEAGALLVATSDDAGAPGADPEFGAGIIDIKRAEQHDRPGIFDMVAVAPYVRPVKPGERDVQIVLYAQNRGTEIVRDLRMTVAIDGVEQVSVYQNVQIGQSVGDTYPLHRSAAAGPQSFNVVHHAAIVRGTDANPDDNGRQTIVTVK